MNRILALTLGLLAFSSPAGAADTVGWIRDLRLPPGTPLVVLPPAAGAVLGVDEQRKTDSFIQTVTLVGDPGVMGENTVTITVTKGGFAPKISENTINDEVADALPNVPLTMGPVGTQNVFGEFGALQGSRGDMNCVYAWQRVNLADKWVTGHRSNPFDRTYAMTMRYRLCRTRVGAGDLLASVAAAQGGRSWGGGGGRPYPIAGADPLAAATTLGTMPVYATAPVRRRTLADKIGSALGLDEPDDAPPVASYGPMVGYGGAMPAYGSAPVGYGGTVAGYGPVVVLAAPQPAPVMRDLEIRRTPRARVAAHRRAPRAEVAEGAGAQAIAVPAAPPIPTP